MSVAYDAICFDMDGVLLSGYHTDRSVYRQAAAATLADFGVSHEGDPPPDLVDPETISDVRATCDLLSIPATPVWAYREHAATTIENERIAAGDRQPFGDVSVLSELAEEYTIGIVSNNRQGTVRFVAEYFDLDVDVVRGRFPTLEEFGSLKPDPMLLEWTLERLDTDDVLYVGDRQTDVEAADIVGIDSALLSRDGAVADGGSDPDYHIESLTELPDLLDR